MLTMWQDSRKRSEALRKEMRDRRIKVYADVVVAGQDARTYARGGHEDRAMERWLEFRRLATEGICSTGRRYAALETMRASLDATGKLMVAGVDAGDERWTAAAQDFEAKTDVALEQCRGGGPAAMYNAVRLRSEVVQTLLAGTAGDFHLTCTLQ